MRASPAHPCACAYPFSFLSAFEAAVQETVGKYSVGDEITLADVCIPPQMATARRFAQERDTNEGIAPYHAQQLLISPVCVLPVAPSPRRCSFKVDLTPYPTIVRIDQELALHPAFIAAHPNQQADRPEGITA